MIEPNRPLCAARLPEDAPRLARTLAAAFHDDPVFGWLMPDADARRRRLPRLFELLLELDAPRATVLASPDGAAVSVWLPPGGGTVPATTFVRRAPTLLALFGRHVLRSLRVSDAIEAHMPAEPFWYAHFIAVDPAAQGGGWGRAMVAAGLAEARRRGLPCYLETATRRNLSFYGGQGFVVTGDWQVRGGGPRLWSMRHDPAGDAA